MCQIIGLEHVARLPCGPGGGKVMKGLLGREEVSPCGCCSGGGRSAQENQKLAPRHRLALLLQGDMREW